MQVDDADGAGQRTCSSAYEARLTLDSRTETSSRATIQRHAVRFAQARCQYGYLV